SRSFSYHLDLQMRHDLTVQLDRNLEIAKLFDRFRKLQLAALDVEPLLRQRGRDVGARYRSVQRVGLADFSRDDDLEIGQPLGYGTRDLLLFGLPRLKLLPLALDLFLVAFRRKQGELAREQVVARVAVGNLHDLAAASQFLDMLSQNDFHRVPLSR